jgi:phosphate acetyltransferase
MAQCPRLDQIVRRAAQSHFKPVCAVVHPCDEVSLQAALDGARMNFFTPLLVGPRKRIEAVAQAHDFDLSGIEIIDTPHSHASAETAVELVQAHKAGLLMKGSLHTDELMHAVVDHAGGLRTERRLSHVFVIEVPRHENLLLITDAAINIAPDLDAKADIVRNAIDLHQALGLGEPRVAILAAVEQVSSRMPSTLDAAALCKMADRGQITGALLDGPLALDNAINLQAASIKGIHSEVAGRAQVLVVPDLEAGNMLAKNLSFLSDAVAAGVVLGARVPIILTSRADTRQARQVSCAVAVLLGQWMACPTDGVPL